MEWKQVIFDALLERNRRVDSCRLVYADYGKSLQHIYQLENKIMQLEINLARLRSRPSLSPELDLNQHSLSQLSDSKEHVRDLEAKLMGLQSELSSCYKIITEKSEVAIRLKENAIKDEKAVMEMQKQVEVYKEQHDSMEVERDQLESEVDELKQFIEQQNEEIISLRVIQGSLQDSVHRLTMDNKMYFEQLMAAKNQQAEEMNKMTELLNSMRVNSKSEKTVDVQPIENISSASLLDELELKTSFNVSIPRRANKTFSGHASEVSACRFDGTGRRIISGGVDEEVRIWNVAEGNCITRLKGNGKTFIDVNISMDSCLASGSGNDPAIYIWSLRTNRIFHLLTGHKSKVTSACFTSDSRSLLSGSYDRTLKKWDLETGAYSKSFNCTSCCNHAALSPDGNTIATAHLDGHARFWSLRSGKCIFDLEGAHTKPVSCVEFSRIGTVAVTIGKDSMVNVFDLRKNEILYRLSDSEYSNNTNFAKFGFSPDGKHVVVGSSSGDIFIWDIQSGKLAERLVHHKTPVTCCDWSSSGLGIVSSDKKGTVLLWS